MQIVKHTKMKLPKNFFIILTFVLLWLALFAIFYSLLLSAILSGLFYVAMIVQEILYRRQNKDKKP